MKIESKYNYHDVVFIMYRNKIRSVRICEINFGIARSPGPFNKDLFKAPLPKYMFFKESISDNDYVLEEEFSEKPLEVYEINVFKTKEELIKYLEQ